MNNKEQQMLVLDDYSIIWGEFTKNIMIESKIGEKFITIIFHNQERFFKELEEKRNRK